MVVIIGPDKRKHAFKSLKKPYVQMIAYGLTSVLLRFRIEEIQDVFSEPSVTFNNHKSSKRRLREVFLQRSFEKDMAKELYG